MASSENNTNTSESSGKSGKSFVDSVVEGAGKTVGAAAVIGGLAFFLSGGNPVAGWAAFKTALLGGAATNTIA